MFIATTGHKKLATELAALRLLSEQNSLIGFEAADGKLVMTAAQDGMIMQSQVEAEIAEEGSMSAGVVVTDIVKACDDNVMFVKDRSDGPLDVKSGSFIATIKSGDALKFPIINTEFVDWHSVPADELREVLQAFMYAIPKDATSNLPNGAIWHSTSAGLNLISTDGYRLAIVKQAGEFPGEERLFAVPRKAMQALLKMIDGLTGNIEIKLVIANGAVAHVQFAHPLRRLFTPPLVARIPPYQRVIPSVASWQATVSRADIQAALAQVMASSPNAFFTTLVFEDNKITVKSEDSKSTVVALTQATKEISLNPKFLQEALARIDTAEIVLCGDAETRPFVITGLSGAGVDARHIIMPITPPPSA